MKIIGLSGGIGVGKSTVSNYLLAKGYTIIDADLIAHQITSKGSEALDELAAYFGHDILLEDGSLNRKKLGEMVFSQPQKKQELERIVTAKVIARVFKELERHKDAGLKVVFLDAPLLFESGMDKYCHQIWVVTCDLETRISRVMARDNLSRQLILDRISNQMDEKKKMAKAHHILDNSGSSQRLYEQIETLLRKIDE